MSDFESIYPPKPKLLGDKQAPNWQKTLLGFFLFASLFLLISANNWQLLLIFIAVIIIHELGHFVFMKLFKYKDVRMFFIPFFNSKTNKGTSDILQNKRILILFAGPLPGIILGMVAFYLAIHLQNQYLMWFAIIALTLNVFNLMPVDPLDGGKLLDAIFTDQQSHLKVIFSFGSSLVFIVLGYLLSSWILVISGFLLGFRVRMLQKTRTIHSELDEKEINYQNTYKFLSDSDYWIIRDSFILNTPGLKDVVPGLREVWDNEQLIANQINQLLLTPMKNNISTAGKVFYIALWVIALAGPIFAFSYFDINWFTNEF